MTDGVTSSSARDQQLPIEGGAVDARQVGQAGLRGWRGKVADRVAPAVADRTSLDTDQVRAAVGGLFLVLSTLYLVKVLRDLLRR
jgi:hypothetical protein